MTNAQYACKISKRCTHPARIMSYTNVRIHDSLMQQIENQKTGWQSTTAIVNDLIASALIGQFDKNTLSPLTIPPYPSGFTSKNLGSEAVTSNAGALPKALVKEAINRNPDRVVPGAGDPYRLKTISAEFVPEDLAASADLFCEWWSVRGKGAVRSKKVAEREFTKLRAFKPADRAAALQKAIAGGWKQLYEPKDLHSFNTPQEAPSNHPAHKVFKADDLGPEWDIPSATGGKGVLEGMF